MHEEPNAKRYYVSGMVQGVGYRYFAERAAMHLKVMGYVRNLRDGRVEVYAIAPAETLAALRRGPRTRSVWGHRHERDRGRSGGRAEICR